MGKQFIITVGPDPAVAGCQASRPFEARAAYADKASHEVTLYANKR